VTDVKHFVLVYAPEAGRLHVQECHDNGDVAMRRRFELERCPQYADMEIVVLTADSIETLYEGHGRYFRTLPQLLQRLRDELAA
jgi:hypothetical protein